MARAILPALINLFRHRRCRTGRRCEASVAMPPGAPRRQFLTKSQPAAHALTRATCTDMTMRVPGRPACRSLTLRLSGGHWDALAGQCEGGSFLGGGHTRMALDLATCACRPRERLSSGRHCEAVRLFYGRS